MVEDLKRLGAIRAREAGKRAPPWISSKPSAKHVMKQRSIPDEQKILKDNSQTLAKGGRRVAAALRALEDNFSLRRRHAARQTSQEAGLSGSGWPYNCDETFPRGISRSIPRKSHRSRLFNPNPRSVTCSGLVGHSLPRLASAIDSFSEPRWAAGIDLHEPGGKYAIAKFRIFFVHRKQRMRAKPSGPHPKFRSESR